MQTASEFNLNYNKQLDGLRCISVMAVMISHFVQVEFIQGLPLGFGVLFFFVLSSFLITRILLSVKTANDKLHQSPFYSLRQFYLRRILRIFPAYYALIGFMFLVNWPHCRNIIFSLLTYTTNFEIGRGVESGDFIHLWSLAVEEQFYIFFPLVILFTKREFLFKIFVSFILVGLAGRTGLYLYNCNNVYFSNFNTISCFDSLGIGALLAYYSFYNQIFLNRLLSNRLLFAGVVILFLVTMLLSYSLPSGLERYNFTSVVIMRFAFNVMCFWILGFAITGYTGFVKLVLEAPAIVFFGKISYGLYLYHLFTPRLLDLVIGKLGCQWPVYLYWTKPFVYILVTTLIAFASWFFFEKRINDLKKYFAYNKTFPASHV